MIEMVMRYGLLFNQGTPYVGEKSKGHFVDYTDYATLEAEIATLKRERDSLSNELDALEEEQCGYDDVIRKAEEARKTAERQLAEFKQEAAEVVGSVNNAIGHMLGAIEGNGIDSEEISGDFQTGIPPHKWHEEWAAYARRDLEAARTFLDTLQTKDDTHA